MYSSQLITAHIFIIIIYNYIYQQIPKFTIPYTPKCLHFWLILFYQLGYFIFDQVLQIFLTRFIVF